MSYFPMFGRKLKMSWKIISQFSLFNFALDNLAWIELFSRKMLAKKNYISCQVKSGKLRNNFTLTIFYILQNTEKYKKLFSH